MTLCIVTGCGNDKLEKSRSVGDAKEIVDDYINSWNNSYKRLCDKPRNDNLKLQFQKLHDDMTIISTCGELCNKLSYEEQIAVSDYAWNMFEKSEPLKKLLETGEVDCW